MKLAMRILVMTLFIAATVAAFRFIEVPSCGTLQNFVHDKGPWGPFYFFLAYIVSTVAFVPGTIVTMLAGLVFGVFWGSVLVIFGATFGAFLSFLIARYLARRPVEKMLRNQPWFSRFEQNISGNGFSVVCFLRLIPIIPFNAFNYACGLTALRARDYLFGSFVGMLPGTIAYVYLGETGCRLIDPLIAGNLRFHDYPPDVVRGLVISSLLLAGTTALPFILRRLKKAPLKF